MKEKYVKPDAEIIDFELSEDIMDQVVIPSIEIGDGEGEEW